MKKTIGTVVGLMLLGAAVPALAHHSFAAEFDANKCGDVVGTLTKIDYINPHAYIYLKTDKGEDATFQLSSTSNLKRGGADRPTLMASVGKTVTVRGCSARNGETHRYAASFIKLADGTVQRLGQDVEGIFGTKIWK